MKKKRRLKTPIKIVLTVIPLLIITLLTITYVNSSSVPTSSDTSDFTYVNDYIFDEYYPVVAETSDKIIRPYNAEKINLYRSFYEKDGTEKEQEKSIILSDGTYVENTGVDYSSDDQFDVVAAYKGTVTNIIDDAILGKSVEIKSTNNLTIMYQSLSNVTVKKGDTVNQGDVIAKSGKSTLNADVKNSLHIEVYLNGQAINPETVYDKTLKSLTDNE